MSTNENLSIRDFAFPSICDLCMSQGESSNHLFFLLYFCQEYLELIQIYFGHSNQLSEFFGRQGSYDY